jgi:hypothetical protein
MLDFLSQKIRIVHILVLFSFHKTNHGKIRNKSEEKTCERDVLTTVMCLVSQQQKKVVYDAGNFHEQKKRLHQKRRQKKFNPERIFFPIETSNS